jgi:thioredoxin 1
MSQTLAKLSDSELEDRILQSDRPLLVDFWAEWCGPCRAVAPALEALRQDYDGRATIAKLNVDENPEAAARFGVRSIPTLILFQNGEEKERLVGAHPKATIAALLDRYAA